MCQAPLEATVPRLPDTMRPCSSLQIILGIEIAVDKDNGVCANQVQPNTTYMYTTNTIKLSSDGHGWARTL